VIFVNSVATAFVAVVRSQSDNDHVVWIDDPPWRVPRNRPRSRHDENQPRRTSCTKDSDMIPFALHVEVLRDLRELRGDYLRGDCLVAGGKPQPQFRLCPDGLFIITRTVPPYFISRMPPGRVRADELCTCLDLRPTSIPWQQGALQIQPEQRIVPGS
jgi:hypothetical protein